MPEATCYLIAKASECIVAGDIVFPVESNDGLLIVRPSHGGESFLDAVGMATHSVQANEPVRILIRGIADFLK